MKTLPPLPQQDELYPSHIKSCIEDYNYWKECIWQFKMVAKDSPAKYSYGKFEKLIHEFCVDVSVHHQKLFTKYYLKEKNECNVICIYCISSNTFG